MEIRYHIMGQKCVVRLGMGLRDVVDSQDEPGQFVHVNEDGNDLDLKKMAVRPQGGKTGAWIVLGLGQFFGDFRKSALNLRFVDKCR